MQRNIARCTTRAIFQKQYFFAAQPFSTCPYKWNKNDEDFKVEIEIEKPEPKWNGYIPKEKLDIKFARSAGPGGQNVNKVNTKVDLRFHVDQADWLPHEVKERLKQQQLHRLNAEGELIIHASTFRTQEQNVQEALERLQYYVETAYKKPKIRQMREGRTKEGDELRLREKKQHGEMKKQRSQNKRYKDDNGGW